MHLEQVQATKRPMYVILPSESFFTPEELVPNSDMLKVWVEGQTVGAAALGPEGESFFSYNCETRTGSGLVRSETPIDIRVVGATVTVRYRNLSIESCLDSLRQAPQVVSTLR